ncbi:hypothetical protein JM93_00219 [Roseibium hamelinense]|uniref:Uncharacterized protein n=1 Tax=Roseibium hamelinense TaxID=150831 RepID=A0A562TIF9_9HYPH|nr:hypothetical protein [Roseibium hamelinense]MTI46131.1 hypothetical protein [Roseibium hamelinense]TWI92676.1 hypothetical protein JM93_00219 [Roseibium hamelinense]
MKIRPAGLLLALLLFVTGCSIEPGTSLVEVMQSPTGQSRADQSQQPLPAAGFDGAPPQAAAPNQPAGLLDPQQRDTTLEYLKSRSQAANAD